MVSRNGRYAAILGSHATLLLSSPILQAVSLGTLVEGTAQFGHSKEKGNLRTISKKATGQFPV